MYKKMKWPLLCMALFCALGGTALIAHAGPGNPPVIYNLIRGNWNHAMKPDGCVVLDNAYRLSIFVNISVGTTKLSALPGLYYKTQFQNGPVVITGPLTIEDFVPETTLSGCEVYTYTKEVFNDSFYNTCASNQYAPFMFDYHISLVDEYGMPYPISDNLQILSPCQYGPIPVGQDLLISTEYSGSRELCCVGAIANADPLMGNVSNENTAEADWSRTISLSEDQDQAAISAVETVEFTDEQNDAFVQPSLTLFPNPFQETLALRFQAKANTKTTIQIWKSNGQLVDQQEVESSFTGTEELNLSTDHLQPDIYFCQLKNEEWSQIVKVIKL